MIIIIPTTSSLWLRSPLRALTRLSSLVPFPRVALWISVAKKHTAARTRGSKAAYIAINAIALRWVPHLREKPEGVS